MPSLSRNLPLQERAMKKIPIVFIILTAITVGLIPQVQAGVTESQSFKLSVTIPKSISLKQEPQSATLPSSNLISRQESSPQNFQLIETVRDNQKVFLKTFVVD